MTIVFLSLHHHHGHFLGAKVQKYKENHKVLHHLEPHQHHECDDFKNQRPFTHYQSAESVDVAWCHRLVSLIATYDFHYFSISNNLKS